MFEILVQFSPLTLELREFSHFKQILLSFFFWRFKRISW